MTIRVAEATGRACAPPASGITAREEEGKAGGGGPAVSSTWCLGSCLRTRSPDESPVGLSCPDLLPRVRWPGESRQAAFNSDVARELSADPLPG